MLWFDKNKQFVKAGYRGQCHKGSDKEGDLFLMGNSVEGVSSFDYKNTTNKQYLEMCPIFSCVAKRVAQKNKHVKRFTDEEKL